MTSEASFDEEAPKQRSTETKLWHSVSIGFWCVVLAFQLYWTFLYDASLEGSIEGIPFKTFEMLSKMPLPLKLPLLVIPFGMIVFHTVMLAIDVSRLSTKQEVSIAFNVIFATVIVSFVPMVVILLCGAYDSEMSPRRHQNFYPHPLPQFPHGVGVAVPLISEVEAVPTMDS